MPREKNDEGQFSGKHHVACIIPYEGAALKNNLGRYSWKFLQAAGERRSISVLGDTRCFLYCFLYTG